MAEPAVDPKDEIISEGWTERVQNPDDPNDTSDKYYAYVRRYADGRVVTEYHKRSGSGVTDPNDKSFKPDAPIKTTTTVNPDQKKAFDQQQTNPRQNPQPVAPGGVASRIQKGPDGLNHLYGYNPQTGNYDVDQGAAESRTSRQVEGTPDPSKPDGYDNTRPVMVTRDAQSNAIIKSEPLTAAERTQWEKESGQVSSAAAKEEVPGHPGVYHVVTKDSAGNSDDHYENAQGQRVPQPPEPPKVTLTQDGTQAVLTYPDGHVETKATGLSRPPTSGQIIKGGGANGEDVQAVLGPDGKTFTYVPISGAQIPSENRPIPSGAPVFKPDYSQDDLGLQAYDEQLLAAQRAKIIDAEQGRRLVAQASALAQTVASHGTAVRAQAATTRGQDITQRGQDINEAESRRSFQGSGFDTTLREIGSNAKYLGAGHGGMAADAFLEALNVRQRYAAGAGGFANVPQVASPAAAAAAAGTQVHIGADGNVAISPPGSVPPNAIGVGAIGNQPAPGGAPDQAASAQRQADIQANPVFRPPPPISGAPSGPTAPLPSAYPAADEYGRTQASGGAAPPVNPPTGESGTSGPSYDPTQPVGMGQGLPSYLQSVMPPTWQPHGVLGQLRAQGYSDDELQQAMQMAGVG